jgi:hypothetical protein
VKAEKRARLIREAVDYGRRLSESERAGTFVTVDIKTGLVDGPAMFSFPIEPERWYSEGRYVIDLERIGYRLTPL